MSRLETFISCVDRSVLESVLLCFTSLGKALRILHAHDKVKSDQLLLSCIPSLSQNITVIGTDLRDRVHASRCPDLALTRQCPHLWKALLNLDTEAVWYRGYWQGINLKAPTRLFWSHFSYCKCNSHVFALWHRQTLWESQETWNSDIMGK